MTRVLFRKIMLGNNRYISKIMDLMHPKLIWPQLQISLRSRGIALLNLAAQHLNQMWGLAQVPGKEIN